MSEAKLQLERNAANIATVGAVIGTVALIGYAHKKKISVVQKTKDLGSRIRAWIQRHLGAYSTVSSGSNQVNTTESTDNNTGTTTTGTGGTDNSGYHPDLVVSTSDIRDGNTVRGWTGANIKIHIIFGPWGNPVGNVGVNAYGKAAELIVGWINEGRTGDMYVDFNLGCINLNVGGKVVHNFVLQNGLLFRADQFSRNY